MGSTRFNTPRTRLTLPSSLAGGKRSSFLTSGFCAVASFAGALLPGVVDCACAQAAVNRMAHRYFCIGILMQNHAITRDLSASGVYCSPQPVGLFSHPISAYFLSLQKRREEFHLGKIARRITLAGLVAAQLLIGPSVSFAGDVKIPIPLRGVSTPTEKLNREGVAELKRGHRDKAKQLFYKAYLFDPQDPFTLNNLGYVAELEGDAERALRYYELAEKDHTDAIIDRSSEASLKGKPLDAAFHQIEDADRSSSKISE